MAHWAQIDDNNIVTGVFVGSNDDPDEGLQWLLDNIGGRFIQTSYNTIAGVHVYGGTPLRGNYAAVGYSYDETLDAFIPPKPGEGDWKVDPKTFQWVSVAS